MRSVGRVPELSCGDIRMQARAIRGRWPIRPERRQQIVDTLSFIATNPHTCGVREAVAAAKALLDADRINIDDEARQVRGPELIEVAGRVKVSFESMTDEELDRFIESGGEPRAGE